MSAGVLRSVAGNANAGGRHRYALGGVSGA
jgi:hypothetical protein